MGMRVRVRRRKGGGGRERKERKEQEDQPDVLEVGEDEGLANVESNGDDVSDVLTSQSLHLLQTKVLPQILLIIGHLDHQRYIEDILQPSLGSERGEDVKRKCRG
jgi:hypothetical protein